MLKLDSFRYVNLTEPLPLPIVSAFIRLGNKYGIQTLCIEGKTRIFSEIPANWADMAAGPLPTWKFVTQPDIWFELVLFARATGLLSILPYTLYVCCAMHPSEIKGGIKREDGTMACLSKDDQITCLAGWQIILTEQMNTTYTWVDTNPHHDDPFASKKCSLIRQKSKMDLLNPPTIAGLYTFDAAAFDLNNLCSICLAQAEAMHNTGREELWEKLPSLFDLPPWEELKKEREMCVPISSMFPSVRSLTIYTNCIGSDVRIHST